jgi:hypothetical protein
MVGDPMGDPCNTDKYTSVKFPSSISDSPIVDDFLPAYAEFRDKRDSTSLA